MEHLSERQAVFARAESTDRRHQPPLPAEGTASYRGGAGGRYLYKYGDNWGDAKGKISSEEFAATATLKADFAAGTIKAAWAAMETSKCNAFTLPAHSRRSKENRSHCWPIPWTMSCVSLRQGSIRAAHSKPTRAQR